MIFCTKVVVSTEGGKTDASELVARRCDVSKSPGEVDHTTKYQTEVTIEQVAASVQQSPKRSMIWHRAQAHQQNDFRRIMKEDCIDFIFT